MAPGFAVRARTSLVLLMVRLVEIILSSPAEALDLESEDPTPSPDEGEIQAKPSRNLKVDVAGVLIIGAGLLAFLNGAFAFIGESATTWFDDYIGLNRFTFCGTLLMIIGAVAIAGGISALLQKRLSLALAGAIFGALGDGLAGFVFGLTAIALLFTSDEDF